MLPVAAAWAPWATPGEPGIRMSGATTHTAATVSSPSRTGADRAEYEVVRLILDPAAEAGAADRFGGGGLLSYRLRPPVLRAERLNGRVSGGRARLGRALPVPGRHRRAWGRTSARGDH
ncbi:hypothetical protein ACWD00_39525 [Streptomyces viridiviolaceus]